jgi:hypothetical protein
VVRLKTPDANGTGTWPRSRCAGLSGPGTRHCARKYSFMASPRKRTPQNKIVIFEGDENKLTGKILDIAVKESTGFTTYGDVI